MIETSTITAFCEQRINSTRTILKHSSQNGIREMDQSPCGKLLLQWIHCTTQATQKKVKNELPKLLNFKHSTELKKNPKSPKENNAWTLKSKFRREHKQGQTTNSRLTLCLLNSKNKQLGWAHMKHPNVNSWLAISWNGCKRRSGLGDERNEWSTRQVLVCAWTMESIACILKTLHKMSSSGVKLHLWIYNSSWRAST